jgi:hypothetical protein
LKKGLCHLCSKDTMLSKSHAIPDRYFKSIKKLSGGNFIVISDGPQKARRTIESGWDYLFCIQCEEQLNIEYDNYIIKNIDSMIDKSIASDGKLTFKCESSRLYIGLMSWLWRASISSNEIYSSAKLPDSHEKLILKMLIDRKIDNIYSVSLSYIIDKTNKSEGGFTRQSFREFIVPPIIKNVSYEQKGKNKKGFGTIMIVGGICILYLFPSMSWYRGRKLGYISPFSETITLKSTHIFDIPFLLDFFVQAVKKEKLSA